MPPPHLKTVTHICVTQIVKIIEILPGVLLGCSFGQICGFVNMKQQEKLSPAKALCRVTSWILKTERVEVPYLPFSNWWIPKEINTF